MKIGSLFSGIGGIELGLERAGLGSVAWQVEQDPFCRAVLAQHWPTADRSCTDVRLATASNLARVDLICGGFPCQDVSSAGLGAGLDGARSGLWREFARIVAELRPRTVVVENVASGKARWLCEVQRDLRELGYRTRTFALSAEDCGAPHRRGRIFVVGHADGAGLARGERTGIAPQSRPAGAGGWRDSEPGVGRGADGVSAGLDGGAVAHAWPARRGLRQHAWEPPRVVRRRGRDHAERLTALGNAVVPAQAEAIGRVVRAVST